MSNRRRRRLFGASGGLRNFLAAIARVRAGTGNCRIICVGDSTTRGYNAGIAGADIFDQAYPTVLAALLEADIDGVTVRSDQSVIGTGGMASYAWGDGRITSTMTSLSGGVGAFFRATSAGSFTFDPGYTWDTADIYYVRTSTIGFDYQIGAGAPVSPTVAGTPQPAPAMISVSKAAGSETLTLSWTAGDFRLAGVHLYNAADRLLQVFNAGVNGAQASSVTSSTAGTGGLHWIPFWDADLAILNFGINDFFVSKSVATFTSEMQQIISAFKAAGTDVILTTSVPTSITGTPTHVEYMDALRDLAIANKLLLVDIFATWVDWATGNALGWYSDATHPTATGYAEIAEQIAGVISAQVPAVPTIGYGAEATAFFAAMATDPGTTRKDLYAALIDDLIAAGTWAKRDAIWVTAAHEYQTALINLKAPGTYDLTEVNMVGADFTTDRGYTGGTNKYLDTNFNPTTASSPNYTQSSACLTAYVNNVVSDAGATTGVMGLDNTTGVLTFVRPRSATDFLDCRINSSSASSFSPVTSRLGRSTVSRTGSTVSNGYRNGTVVGSTSAAASGTMQNKNIHVLRNGTSGWNSNDRIAYACLGGGLDATEEAAEAAAFLTFLTAIGAN
jgi:lysophospholipase L1-like esterase